MDTSHVDRTDFTGWIAPPTDIQAVLTEDISCEVAVIGGGLGGMATALRLAARGADVVLLEAEFCGFGSSSRNAGQLAGGPGGDIQLLNILYGKKLPGIVRFAEHAARHVEELIDRLDIDCEYEPVGNSLAAVSRGQMGRVRRIAKVLTKAGGNIEVGTSAELGIPRGFLGAVHEPLGGTMNPGKFTMGVRRALLASPARVFEQTTVTDVHRNADSTAITTPGATVHAQKVVLSTNAFVGDLAVTPPRLAVPIWIVECETEPIAPERLAELGWTSRAGVVTQHNLMENYRLTPRNTIVFGVRRLERGKTYPLPKKSPDQGLVDELARGFERRFPSLSDVAVERAWGGWIAITSSWLPLAGKLDGEIYYSIACNGHGLGQAPYLGSLIADLVMDGTPHEDLATLWSAKPKFARPMMMGAPGLRTIWAIDRFNDMVNGSKRNGLRGALRA